ncbi:Aspartyl protease family protein At5g10770 [Linum perenne]
MASANSKISKLSILLIDNFHFIIIFASYVLIGADGARTQQLIPSTLQRQELESESPIHTDKYGLGVTLTLTPDDGFFFVTVGLGTPKRDFTLLFDTGSDISWVICNSSSSNDDTSFNPSLSSTSSDVSCTNCNYSVNYHDGSQSSGIYANDTLTLGTEVQEVKEGFIFGCAEKFVGDFGRTVGVLGLGHGYFNLLAQMDTDILGIFCYCLPLTDSSTGSLWFGIQAVETCHPASTKMISLVIQPNNNGLTNYFVQFTGITIGQQRLEFASFLPSSSQMNTIIDSGTVVTRLPMAVYTKLREAFEELMSGYVKAERTKVFDTCYNLVQESDWVPPEMTLHFEGTVDVKLDPSAVILKKGDENPMAKVCLAFAANANDGDLTIIGSQQHRGLKVYYDVNGKRLAFVAGGCSSV